MHKSLLIILVLLCSCKEPILVDGEPDIRTNNPLLNGHQYTLWYLKESGDKNPEFLYMDCYGECYTLGFDIQTAYFSPLTESDLTGTWKYDSDTSIYLNDLSYSIITSRDTITTTLYSGAGEPIIYTWENLQVKHLQNKSTGKSILLRETLFPVNLYTYVNREEDSIHYEKWGETIKQSLLLDGWDYKLWHWMTRKTRATFERGDIYEYDYYDKYGKTGVVGLYQNGWYFNNPYDDDEDYINNWYQKKDKVYKDADFRFTIKSKQSDTLRLQSIDKQHEYIRVDAGITPQK